MPIVRVPRYMRDGDLRLRPLRISDGPYIAKMLAKEDILRACGVSQPAHISWVSLYMRLRSLFLVCYCIEYSSEKIGLAGLYNACADGSAEMALMIFKDARRRMGNGTTVFRMFSTALERRRLVRKWFVSVRRDNVPAYEFWTKLGFEEVSQDEGTIKMTLAAGPRPDSKAVIREKI